VRLAVVTPYVASVLGNRGAFVIARELAQSHDVTVFAHTVSSRILEEVRSLVAPARLDVLHTPSIPPAGMGRLLWLQLVRGPDRSLARRLQAAHEQAPLDGIFVRSDEGHWIGTSVREWATTNRPVTVLGVLELIDHPFLLRRDRGYPALRSLTAPVYPWMHRIEADRLRSFDALVTNSRWTTTLLGYLYGLPVAGEVDAYDDARFTPGAAPSSVDPYVAVPTASLDARTVPWVERLAQDRVPLRLYGPRTGGSVATEGFLPEPRMIDLIRGARATLFLFDYEAFGLIPVESLALGTPVITLPKQAPYEEHRSNPNVRFVRSYPEALAACREALRSPKTSATTSGCQASVARYRPSVAAATLLAVIDSVRVRRSRNG
jgi:hypothetical protein